jgi:hypothetical protein
MSIYKPKGSNVYWLDFVFEGRRIRQSTKSVSRTLARQAEQQRRLELVTGYNNINQPKRRQTFAEAAQDFINDKASNIADSTLDIYRFNLSHLTPVFGRKVLTEITLGDINTYRTKRLTEPVRRRRGNKIKKAPHLTGPRTVNMEVAALRSIMIRNAEEVWKRISRDLRPLPTTKKLAAKSRSKRSRNSEKNAAQACPVRFTLHSRPRLALACAFPKCGCFAGQIST